MHKFELDTPCLVIDKQKLHRNIDQMQLEVTRAGKQLRPHAKTHKCSKIAKYQLAQGAVGICTTKVSEAQVFAAAGVSGILITSPVISPVKIKALLACRQQDQQLMVVCDTLENATQLNEAAARKNLTLGILVDIDAGVARTGTTFDSAQDLAQFIHVDCPHLNLEGIQCYAGNLQHITDYAERKEASLMVMQQAAQMKESLLAAGLPCAILTGSGTGTYEIDMQLSGITEVQPGSYTVMDVEYAEIGSKEASIHFQRFSPSMTLLTTVISANHQTHVTVDCGTKGVYFDPQTKPKIISHQGLFFDWAGFGDEHGKVMAKAGYTLPKVGEVIEMVVPHCDPTINLYDCFQIVENDLIIDQWPIDTRGCLK